MNSIRSDSDHTPAVLMGCDLYNAAVTGETVSCMNANSNASANHAGPSVLLIMDHGDNSRAVCFQQNQRDEVRDMGEVTGAVMADSGSHNTNYVVYPGVGITSPKNGNNPKPGDPCPTLTEDSRNYLVGKIEAGVQPCLTGAFMGGQGAKARSIAWCADGTTPTLKSAPSGGNTIPDVVYRVKEQEQGG